MVEFCFFADSRTFYISEETASKWEAFADKRRLTVEPASRQRLFRWKPHARYSEQNAVLGEVRVYLEATKKNRNTVLLVIASSEWCWLFNRGRLRPNCFIPEHSSERLWASLQGTVSALCPGGPTVVYSMDDMRPPAALGPTDAFIFPEPAIAEALDLAPPHKPQREAQHKCDEACKGAVPLLFHYDPASSTLIVGARREDGGRCWFRRTHSTRFVVATLREEAPAEESPAQPPLKRPKLEKYRPSQSAGASNKFTKLASGYIIKDSQKSEPWLSCGLWMCRETGGGSTRLHTRKKEGSVYLVPFTMESRFREMLYDAYDDWDRVECFDLSLGGCVTTMRRLGMKCGPNHEMDEPVRPVVAYLVVSTAAQNSFISYKCGSSYRSLGLGDLETLRAEIATTDPDLVVCLGLRDHLERGFLTSLRNVVEEAQGVPHLRKLCHIESSGYQLVSCMIRAVSKSKSRDAGVEVCAVDELERENHSIGFSESIIQASYAIGLTSLGEELETMVSMDRMYAGQVDRDVCQGIPVSCHRGTKIGKYQGGLVIANPNYERRVYRNVVELDFEGAYPNIIRNKRLSPDPVFVLPHLLESLMSKRAAIKEQIAALKKSNPDDPSIRLLSVKEKETKLGSNKASGWLGRHYPVLAERMTTYGRESLDVLAQFVSGKPVSLSIGESPSGELDVIRKGGACTVVYGDTDSIFVLVKDPSIETISQLYSDLTPYLNRQCLRLTPRKLLTNYVPMDGKRYVCEEYRDILDSCTRLGPAGRGISSSLLHTTHLFPEVAKRLLEEVVQCVVTGQKVQGFAKVVDLLSSGLEGVPWGEFVCQIKVSSDMADGHVAEMVKELRSLLAKHEMAIPGEGELISYVRAVNTMDSEKSVEVIHVPEKVFKLSREPFFLDVGYYVNRYIIKPASLYLGLDETGTRELFKAWCASQTQKQTLIYPPEFVPV